MYICIHMYIATRNDHAIRARIRAWAVIWTTKNQIGQLTSLARILGPPYEALMLMNTRNARNLNARDTWNILVYCGWGQTRTCMCDTSAGTVPLLARSINIMQGLENPKLEFATRLREQ